MKYLSTRALEGLKRYQYKPSGYTFLDHVHAPFWNCECGQCWQPPGNGVRGLMEPTRGHQGLSSRARMAPHPRLMPGAAAGSVELLPLWLAPNLITLLGTMWLVLAYGINAYYSPDFEGGWRGAPTMLAETGDDWFRPPPPPRAPRCCMLHPPLENAPVHRHRQLLSGMGDIWHDAISSEGAARSCDLPRPPLCRRRHASLGVPAHGVCGVGLLPAGLLRWQAGDWRARLTGAPRGARGQGGRLQCMLLLPRCHPTRQSPACAAATAPLPPPPHTPAPPHCTMSPGTAAGPPHALVLAPGPAV